ncbi:MAG: hypothetical protein LBF27_22765, partial [Sphingobacterium sp.]|nr:hypothetical protein [Sphingobacterium sp.]
SEQRSQARQSRWYCRNRWESRSVPFLIRSPFRKLEGLLFCAHFPEHKPADAIGVTDGKVSPPQLADCLIRSP